MGYNTVFGSHQVDFLSYHFNLLGVNVLGTLKYDKSSLSCEDFLKLYIPKLGGNGYVFSVLRGKLARSVFDISKDLILSSQSVKIFTDAIGYNDLAANPHLYSGHYFWISYINKPTLRNEELLTALRARSSFILFPNINDIYVIDALLLWREAVISANTFDTKELIKILPGLSVDSIEGRITLGKERYTYQTVSLYKIENIQGTKFDLKSLFNLEKVLIPRNPFYLFNSDGFRSCEWPEEYDINDYVIKIGVLFDLSGQRMFEDYRLFVGIISTIYFINQEEPILSKIILPYIKDSMSNTKTEKYVQEFIEQGDIMTIFACSDINCMNIVQSNLINKSIIHFFPGFYTGHVCYSNLVFTGYLPNQLFGSYFAYSFSNGISIDYIILTDKSAVSSYYEEYIERIYGFLENQLTIETSESSEQDISSLIKNNLKLGGTVFVFVDAITYENLLLSGSLDQKLTLEYIFVSPIITTDDIYRINSPLSLTNILFIQSYHESSKYSENEKFKKILRDHGSTPYISVGMESAFAAVKFWSESCKGANSEKPENYMNSMLGIKIDSGSGQIQMMDSRHSNKIFIILKFNSEGKIEILSNIIAPIFPFIYNWDESETTQSLCDYRNGNGYKQVEFVSVLLASSITGTNSEKNKNIILPLHYIFSDYYNHSNLITYLNRFFIKWKIHKIIDI